MLKPVFPRFCVLSASLLLLSQGLALADAGRRTLSCVGAWPGAVPVMVEIVDGKVFQNGEEIPDATIGEERIAYSKRDGADLFKTLITLSSGRLTISVFQFPKKEEQAFLEGKCSLKP
jgi:hypothetical protein